MSLTSYFAAYMAASPNVLIFFRYMPFPRYQYTFLCSTGACTPYQSLTMFIYTSAVCIHCFKQTKYQTWGESTFNDSESESDSGRLFDSESESDSSQFGYDSESNSDSSNISISDSESDSNFQLLI